MADSWLNSQSTNKDIANRSRPSQVPLHGSNPFIGRDVRENLTHIPVNGQLIQGDFSSLSQTSQLSLPPDCAAGSVFTMPTTNQPWNVQNIGQNTNMSLQDKRSLPRAKKLQEIANSLQPFAHLEPSPAANYGLSSAEINLTNDTDRSILEKCVSLGFDEGLSRDVLKASKGKSFEVILETLSSLSSVSGRKSIKSLAPGSLQPAKSSSSLNNPLPAQVSRSSTLRNPDIQVTPTQKLFGVAPTSPWVMGTGSGMNQSSSSMSMKSSALPPSGYSGGSTQFVRQPMPEMSSKGPISSNPDLSFTNTIRQAERNPFSFGERKTSDNSQPFVSEVVKLRQHRPERKETMKRWSADVLQKVRYLEIGDKRSSLTSEINDKVTSMEIPDKPPPPYPYSGATEAPETGFEAWLLNSKFSSGSNLRRIASQETLSRLGTSENARKSSPVTILYDNRKNFINVVDRVPVQGPHRVSGRPQAPFSAGINTQQQPPENLSFSNSVITTSMAVTNPPPYSAFMSKNQRPPQKKFNPSERPSPMTSSNQRLYPASNQPSAVYPQYGIDPVMQMPNNHFIPITPDLSGSEEVRPRRSPPPYPGPKQAHASIEKRLSSNLDDDPNVLSKQPFSAPMDIPVSRSDSSGNTSPTVEDKESRCSPIPMTGSPCHTLIVHSDKTLESKLGAAKRQFEPYTTRLKNCSSQAFKFFMEQHVENLMKSREQRERRRHQLEIEMARVGLSGDAQSEMRKMLVQKETNYMRLKRAKMEKSMFSKVKTLGVGAFGEVALVRRKDTGNHLYAMKTLRKSEVLRRNQVAHVKAERDILAEADNEWVVKLYFSFQDSENLYFIMDYVPGGDLMALLIKRGIFDEPLARFYTAELVSALESVHKMGFIHRDIKPDNILIDRDGHIKLTDFGLCTGFRWTHNSKYYQPGGNHARQPSMEPEGGWENYVDEPCDCGDIVKHYNLCKPLERRAARQHMRCLAHSLVGTPNYIAPEVLMRIPYTQLCDWWSVGVILYEMLVGQPPFLATSPADTQLKVINWQRTLRIPSQAKLSSEAADLTLKLLTGPENRLGMNGPDEIKSHHFFRSVNWVDGLKNEKAPFVPTIRHATDTSNFDPVPQKENGSDSNGSDREEEQREILQKGPQHAFYEFTFRRFFDDGGHPHTLYDNEPPPYAGPAYESGTSGGNTSVANSNKRSAAGHNKSVTVPNKVPAPPISKADNKAPVYV